MTSGVYGLLSETCQGDSRTYSYDDFGRMTSSSSTHNNVTNTKNYEYDGLDNITREYTGRCQGDGSLDTRLNRLLHLHDSGDGVTVGTCHFCHIFMSPITEKILKTV